MADAENSRPNDRPWKPVPDPTELTTEALHREITAAKEEFVLRLAGAVSTITARLDGMDKAQTLFEENLNRVPSDTDKQISQLAALLTERFVSFEQRIRELDRLASEKFDGIVTQFRERDTRAEQTFISSKVAVDAALQAAKEAVGEQNRSSALAIAKSEAATDKRIDQIVALVSTATNALDGKIVDMKDRLVRIEGQAIGETTQKAETHQTGGANLAVIMAVIGGLALIVSVVAMFMAMRGH